MTFSFIQATNTRNSLENPVAAPLLRRAFTVKTLPQTATLNITGLGYYRVFLNGEELTRGHLAPYRSNLDHYIYYDCYDIADKLQIGENVLGICLGNGLRNSLMSIWEFDKAPFVGAPIAAFELTLDDTVIRSDEQIKTAPSPILFDDVHYGEYYDARREMPGWTRPGFDDSTWCAALPAKAPRGEYRLCTVEPIVTRNRRTPTAILPYEDGFVYDFGINSAGVCTLTVSGQAGQEITLRHFELMENNHPNFDSMSFSSRQLVQYDRYICKGEGVETYTPSFTYHGFRYVLVRGITAPQATPDLLTYNEWSSDLKPAGAFSCSDKTLNQIQAATVQADISNFHYFPTDCPHREKNGWTADASLSAEQMMLNLTPEKSLAEWMHNIYKALNDKGQLCGMIPTGGWGYEWGNGPAWDNVLVNVPLAIYQYRGDKTVLDNLSAPLMRYLQYLTTRLDNRDLMEIGLGDWCQVDRNESNFETPLVVTDTILTYDIAKKAAFIFGELGQREQQTVAQTLAERVKTAFRKHLILADGTIFGNTQTAQTMALYYGLLEQEEQPAVLNRLLQLIDERDGHFNTGVLGGRVLYRTLADHGYLDLAYHMIVRPDFPSYGNWMARGYTTLCECFDPEGGRVKSLNHHFWGDVSAWMYRYLAGIRVNPTLKDTTHVDIAPQFVTPLDWVKAHHDTPHGRIAVAWQRGEQGVALTITADPRLHGTVTAPKGFVFSDGTTVKPLATATHTLFKIG